MRRSPGKTYNTDAASVVATIPSDTQHDDRPRQPRRLRRVRDLRHSPPATTQQVTPPPSTGREITKYGRRLKPTAALAPGEQAPVSRCINPPITNLIAEKSAQLVKTPTSPMRPVTTVSSAHKKSGLHFCKPLKNPATTYFRAVLHYHRPSELNGRVRNGNVCFLTRMVTGYKSTGNNVFFKLQTRDKPQIKVVKFSSISTGQLRRLLALHLRPINLVVFQGTSRLSSNET